MAQAMTLISAQVLGTATATLTYNAVPQTYRDLYLVCNFGTSSSGSSLRVRFNSDTGGNYSQVHMGGFSTSSVEVGATSTDTYIETLYRVGTVVANENMLTMATLDYSQTDKHKNSLLRSLVPANEQYAVASRWASTAAITRIDVFVSAGNFTAGSTFYLYGIAG